MDSSLYSNRIDRLYYAWICSLAFPDEQVQIAYSNLLDILYHIPFRAVLLMDENRGVDGIDLRSHFSYKAKIPTDIIQFELKDKPCSVLEMMISLANRCEEEIMYDYNTCDRTFMWFFDMLVSLGLDGYSNDNWSIFAEEEIRAIIENCLDRNFLPSGKGGFFMIQNPRQDLRTVDFWTQMCWYANQKINNSVM